MAYSDQSQVQATFAASKSRSQSDSDLLNPTPAGNGVYQAGSLKRNTSMDDLNARSKRKNFLYKLVRPWKWRTRRKSSKAKLQGSSLVLVLLLSPTVAGSFLAVRMYVYMQYAVVGTWLGLVLWGRPFNNLARWSELECELFVLPVCFVRVGTGAAAGTL